MANDGVYLGVWTNYSKGEVLGATYTTTTQHGTLIIAFTGFLIPFVASRFWKILCIALHSTKSTSEPRHAIHHQHQVILRNSSSPDSGLVSLLQTLWAWRQSGSRQDVFKSLLPSILYAVICILISVSIGNEVLLQGENCGIPASSGIEDASFQYMSDMTNDAANYVQQCYSANSSGILSCDEFVTTTIPTQLTEYNASCPFQESMCRGNGTPIRLDTGYLDSNRHLGLNMPSDQSFTYRLVVECSPLVTDGYTSKNMTGDVPSVQYHYGDAVGPNGNINITYQIEDGQYSGTSERVPIRAPGYFAPLPNLLRDDGDVSIFFLSGNGVSFFSQPMDDEWYRATARSRDIGFSGSTNQTLTIPTYKATEAASSLASSLGCVEQFQWCNTAFPNTSGCGPLASWSDAIYGAARFFNVTKADLDAYVPSSKSTLGTRLIWPFLVTSLGSGGPSGITEAATVFGAKALASQNLIIQGLQYQLPLNQWQLDVTRWWNISLVLLQSNFVNTAKGAAPEKWPPRNDDERKLCKSQKIRSNSYTSFSLFGLLFTYVVSALIVLVSFLIEPVLEFLSRSRKYREYEHLEWTANEALQLHRLAHEEAGHERWSGGAAKVPITSQDNLLAPLDISDPKHPVLLRAKLATGISENTDVLADDNNLNAQPAAIALSTYPGHDEFYLQEGNLYGATQDESWANCSRQNVSSHVTGTRGMY
ncbi:hypothetical protein F5Y18DRAFT_443836 [Xylariaceae sp. FL1019]|nr:hypothetical protein F5Y18DRAFT_443836 [Xylariaceae sp. FL1019]